MRAQFFRRVSAAFLAMNFITSSSGLYLVTGWSGVNGVAFAVEAAIPSAQEIKTGESSYSEGREKPKSCKAAQQEAKSACTDANSTSGLGAKGQQAMAQAQQQQQQTSSSSSSTSGAAAACQAAALMNGLQALMAGLKGVGCSAATKDCEEACKNEKDASCGSGSAASATAALGAVFGLLGAAATAVACSQMSSASATPVDCSDATYASTNITCICENDPKNTICTGVEQFASGLTISTGDTGPSSPTYSDDDTLDGSIVDPYAGKAKTSTGSQTASGGGGGGLQGGRGGQYNGSGEGGGPDRSTVDKNVITGTMGGGASASGGSGGSGGGGGGGRGGGGTDGDRFDLSKFLPKAKTRGLAGMSISSKDGITGPMGPSLWEKVSNQYQLQRQNLIQDR